MKKRPPSTPRCVIYTRVSLDRSGEGASNERQEQACRSHADTRGWEVIDVINDISASAYTGAARPGWEKVQQMMRNGECDVVLAWKMDRLLRTVSGLVALVELSNATGVPIATVDNQLDLTSATGKATAAILAAVAQMEVELKGERQALANEQRRNSGAPWPSGFRLFGYTLRGELIPDEADLIRSGAEAFLRGESLAAIARTWTASGISPIKGGQWRNTTVRTLLKNPRLAGFQTHGRKIVPGVRGNWEPILSEDDFALIQLRLGDPGRGDRSGPKGPLPSHLLSGIATCAKCGETVRGQGTDATGRPCYSCPNRCVLASREAMDALVTQGFAMAAITLPGVVIALENRRTRTGSTAEVLAAITRHREELRDLGERWADSPEQERTFIESASRSIEERIRALEEGLLETDDPTDLGRLNAEAVRGFLDLDVQRKRLTLERLARVVLHPKGRGRKNVPLSEQLSLDVRVLADGREGWVPVSRPVDRDTVPRDLALTVSWGEGEAQYLHSLMEFVATVSTEDRDDSAYTLTVRSYPEF